MSDFEAYSDEINDGMDFLEHHGILGQRWGKLNGPPYPLGSGAHSSSEKKAAAAAGVKVGSDSGKGSIANVKKRSSSQATVKKPKKELTEEEKRAEALKAVKTGDKKKIAKYAEYLTSQELQDADNRVRNLSNITREDPSNRKASRAEMEKMEAIRSGDREKIKQHADQMSYQELSEALNRVDLNRKLYPAPKSTMDKIQDVAKKVDQARSVAESGINAYNVAAKIYNSTHKGGAQWPIIQNGNQNNDNNKSKEEKIAQNIFSQMAKDVKNTAQQNNQQQNQNQQSRNNHQNNQRQQTPNVQVPNSVKNTRVSDWDGPSYDELIPDDVKDVWNRKVS